ncbi:MAG: hypothetical protein OHK0029_12730 [Armatimonadaceae bacterium]
MPRKDLIHEAVKNALVRDGWTITADPYRINYGEDRFYIDLAAELPFAAERDGKKIAVEIKSFIQRSPVHDLQEALGQYALYLSILEELDPDRKLYLALGKATFDEIRLMKAFTRVCERFGLALIIVSIETETIEQWIE